MKRRRRGVATRQRQPPRHGALTEAALVRSMGDQGRLTGGMTEVSTPQSCAFWKFTCKMGWCHSLHESGAIGLGINDMADGT